ncbi:MAG: hypothetical protein Q4B50_08475, partial [Bacillota bacterium]|nr:hypothetical protein [Bacillota bacterium]
LIITVILADRDRTELSEMALVIGAGLERGDAKEGGQEDWKLTVELAYKQQNDSSGSRRIFSAHGGSWEELKQELGRNMEKRPHWSNAVVLLLEDSVLEAGEGKSLLREIFLDPQVNGDLLLAVSEAEVSDLFSVVFGESNYLSAGLDQALRLQAKEKGKQPIRLFDYMERVLAMEEILPLPLVFLDAGEKELACLRRESYVAH